MNADKTQPISGFVYQGLYFFRSDLRLSAFICGKGSVLLFSASSASSAVKK
jgi:hypothetical protein